MKKTYSFVFVCTLILNFSTNSYSMDSYSREKDKTNIHTIIDKGIYYKVIIKYLEDNPSKINDENIIGQTVLDRALYLYVYNKENSHNQDIFKQRAEIYKKIIEWLLLKKANRKKDIISYYQIVGHELIVLEKKALEIILEINKDFKQSN